MKIENGLPIEVAGGWDEAGDFGDICLYKVTFIEDFGPIKKGDIFNCIFRFDSQGILSCYNDNDEEVHRVKIKYIPA